MLEGHGSLQPTNADASSNDGDRPRKGQAVRLGNSGDVEAVMDLLRMMHAEVGEEEMDAGKVRNRIHSCLSDGFLCVATSDGQVVGTCGLLFTQFWYSNQTHMADTWFFIHPERRQSSYAAKLKRLCETLAAEMGMKIYWTCVVTPATERKAAFFGRHNRLYAYVYVGGAAQ